MIAYNRELIIWFNGFSEKRKCSYHRATKKKMCGFIDTFNREVEQNLPYGTLYPTKDMMLQNDCCPK
jgi:hypothetical protein